MPALAVFEPGGDAATLLYIVSFSMFIFGVRRGTHPTTAKQGNLIAAVGMAIAVTTTLLLDGIGNWEFIILGLAIGTIAIAFGAINIVGGFLVTDRMLGMFVRKPKPAEPSPDASASAAPDAGGDA